MRAAFTGFWIGLWMAALGLSAYGILFINTHHTGPNQWFHGNLTFESALCCFWIWVSLGPLALLLLRLWKWLFTLGLLGVGLHHELIFGICILLGTTNRGAGWRTYGRWLCQRGAGPGQLSPGQRHALRFGCLIGIALYGLSVLAWYPKPVAWTGIAPSASHQLTLQ